MLQAKDNAIMPNLSTQGRHRDANIISILENAKGKLNTSINQNARYMILFWNGMQIESK